MILLGITGKKRSGKDTVCEFLQEVLRPNIVERVAFADALKSEVAKACGVELDYIDKNKDNFRLILQGWGTDYRRELCSKNYWTEKLLKTLVAQPNNVFMTVVPDVRFLNEADLIHELGGRILRVTRDTGLDDKHQSEMELNLIKADYHLVNNNGLDSLKREVKQLYINKIRDDHKHLIYSARM